MLLGKLSLVGLGIGARVMSSPKMPPAQNFKADAPPVVGVPTPVQAYAPVEEIPEIVVSAKRIPWYAWVAVGVAGFATLNALASRK